MKTRTFILCILAVFIFISCSSETSSNNEKVKEEKVEVKKEPKVVKLWKYSQSEDKMTGDKRYFAECKSTNTIDLGSPWHDVTATIVIRNMDNKNVAILQLSNGNFMSNFMGDKNLRVKFDDEDPVLYGYSNAADGDLGIIFISNPSQVITKIKGSKKLMVEATFFDVGKKIMEFDIEGLKWDR